MLSQSEELFVTCEMHTKQYCFPKVPDVIDAKIYSNIIHFPLCFSGMDVISFHALLNAL